MKKKKFIFLGTNNFKNNAFFVCEAYQNYFEEILKNVNSKDLSNFTNHKFLESRDQKSKLTYLNADQQIELIKECEVIDLASEKERLVKIKELI